MEDRTEPSETTHEAEEADAGQRHEADRVATEGESRDAEDALSKSDPERRRDVAEHEKEMMEIGASVKGEGEID